MTQHDEDRELVAELCEIESGLTEWEVDFVDDIARVVDTRPLSERQRAKARQILEEKGAQ